MTQAIDLTPTQAEVIREVLARHAGRFHRVDVYGSRAQGCALPGSDIDLVVHADDKRVVSDIFFDLDESELSIFADVTLYASAPDALRQEIDLDALTIFPEANAATGEVAA